MIAEERDRDSRERESGIDSGRGRDTLIIVERERDIHIEKELKTQVNLPLKQLPKKTDFKIKYKTDKLILPLKIFLLCKANNSFLRCLFENKNKNTSKLIISSLWKSGTGDL